MNEIYAEMIVFEPNVMNFDLSRLIEHFWYNLLCKLAPFILSKNKCNWLTGVILEILRI